MYCPHCGSSVPSGSLYCSECGAKIYSDQAETKYTGPQSYDAAPHQYVAPQPQYTQRQYEQPSPNPNPSPAGAAGPLQTDRDSSSTSWHKTPTSYVPMTAKRLPVYSYTSCFPSLRAASILTTGHTNWQTACKTMPPAMG